MVPLSEMREDPFLLHLQPQGTGYAERPADLTQGLENHYLRLDHVLDFLRAAWAEGITAGQKAARDEVIEAQKSWPMPEPAQALGALERRLSRPLPMPVPGEYEKALLSLGKPSKETDPAPF